MKTMIKRQDIIAARDVLGLPERATMEEIKSRYRSLMHQWHPDKNPGSGGKDHQAKAAAITEAYRVVMAYCGQYRYAFTDEASWTSRAGFTNTLQTVCGFKGHGQYRIGLHHQRKRRTEHGYGALFSERTPRQCLNPLLEHLARSGREVSGADRNHIQAKAGVPYGRVLRAGAAHGPGCNGQ